MKTSKIINVKLDKSKQCFLTKIVNMVYRLVLTCINTANFSKILSRNSYCAFFHKILSIEGRGVVCRIVKTKHTDTIER